RRFRRGEEVEHRPDPRGRRRGRRHRRDLRRSIAHERLEVVDVDRDHRDDERADAGSDAHPAAAAGHRRRGHRADAASRASPCADARERARADGDARDDARADARRAAADARRRSHRAASRRRRSHDHRPRQPLLIGVSRGLMILGRGPMKARRIAFALLLAMAPTALPSTAFAQDDAVTKAARARFQEGVADFDKGEYEAARAAFLEAYALKQHPAVLLNLAQSCLKSGHYLDAAKYFQKYLNDPQGDKKADASKGLADARAKLGRLDVSAPPGSDVTVDSDSVGKTPLNEAVDVEAGNHTVRVRLPDGTS